LIQDLEHAPEMTAAHQLELTVATFELLGIPVTITGEMPEDRQIAAAFVGMIREAAVNAVIHGNASAVDVVLEEDEEQFRCRVSNNGLPLNGILTPGNGITGIRRSLFPMNGQLEIVKEPAFVLTVKIPKRKM
jgi:signal transduction histidine kinase